MEKSFTQIAEVFIHAARDILVYLLCGVFVIGNLIIIDNCCFDGKVSNLFTGVHYLPVLVILTSYGIGQIIMAIMLILEKIIEPFLLRRKLIKNPDFKKEVNIFQKNRIAYDYFVERYNQLYYMRWTLAGACLLCAFLNFLFGFWCKTNVNLIFILGGSSLLLFVLIIILHYKTGNDLSNKIDTIDETLNKESQ
jgi:hypothetical protein